MMPELSTGKYSTQSVNAYKEHEVNMSSPEKCVLHLYDAAIQSCALGQEDRAGRALAMLIDGLDFKVGGDVATQLMGLYDYCLRLIHRQQFEHPAKILRSLREVWQEAVSEQIAA